MKKIVLIVFVIIPSLLLSKDYSFDSFGVEGLEENIINYRLIGTNDTIKLSSRLKVIEYKKHSFNFLYTYKLKIVPEAKDKNGLFVEESTYKVFYYYKF